MGMAKTHLLLLALASTLSISLAVYQDFCIADLAAGATPAGYPCKPAEAVTAEDFHYGGLGNPSTAFKAFKITLGSAVVNTFPGLNGLGISAARMVMAPGGGTPLHSHPGGTELIFVVQGSVVSGFISATLNKVYTNTLQAGDLMVLPPGQLHFQYSHGNDTAVTLSSFSSDNPGLQILDFALFGNDLPTEVVNKVTALDQLQIIKLKALFGGTVLAPSSTPSTPHDELR
jgi:quercetin dioxygenase-like cupin family protein